MSKYHFSVAASVVALAVGVGAAFISAREANVQAAYAATHCTHYAVEYRVDYNCYASTSPFPFGNNCEIANSYCTNSWALRDSNTIWIYIPGAWEIWYHLHPGGTIQTDWEKDTYGSGNGGSIGASSDYAYSYCLNYDQE